MQSAWIGEWVGQGPELQPVHVPLGAVRFLPVAEGPVRAVVAAGLRSAFAVAQRGKNGLDSVLVSLS